MSFVIDCIRENLPVWQDCLNTEFLRRMGEGTLPEAWLEGYIIDDSLYLRDYAKVFAWGMTKAEDWEDVRACYSLLAFVNEGEGATRLQYLRGFGLTDAEVQRLPRRPENAAYTAYMLEAAREGEGMAECMMACLPCMLSYAWIFRKLLENYPAVQNTVCWPLVRDYTGETYAQKCRDWLAYAEKLCADLSPVRQSRCREIFSMCSRYEESFWKMAGRMRT